jgi:hypothetical protein
MARVERKQWNREALGPLSEATIRAIHGAPEKSRVSRRVYEAGASFPGFSQPGTVYVIEGGFSFSSGDCDRERFVAGDVLVFGGGDYHLIVDDQRTTVVWVWDLVALGVAGPDLPGRN